MDNKQIAALKGELCQSSLKSERLLIGLLFIRIWDKVDKKRRTLTKYMLIKYIKLYNPVTILWDKGSKARII